jgi:predicted HD superfamily hydrolase involved in NAD metabolism
MYQVISDLTQDIQFTRSIRADMVALLTQHGCPRTIEHSFRVAEEARRIAARFGVDEELAEAAGWLHDVSAVFPSGQRLSVARELGIEVLPEEEVVPMILHQKLSLVVAREVFNMHDEAVLSAIGCHTTLKARASALDKVVFLADKIAWDQSGEAPYLADVLAALGQSLDRAVFCYLDYLWQRRHTLAVVHPWMTAAHAQLAADLGAMRPPHDAR